MDREQFQQYMLMMEAIRLAVIATGEATLVGRGYSFTKDSVVVSERIADEALRPLGILDNVYNMREQ